MIMLNQNNSKNPLTRSLSENHKQLIRENIDLVKKIASKIAIFLPRHIEVDDLIHEGILGLIDATVKYDEKYGLKFNLYAMRRIKGAILDYLRTIDWIPRRIRRLSKKIESSREFLRQTLNREPSTEELAQHLEITTTQLSKIQSAVEHSQWVSFEDLQQFCNTYYIPEEKVTANCKVPSKSEFELMEIKSALKIAIMELSEKERLVLAMYYIEDLTLKEIKLVLNISEARISQIHTQALKKLKSIIKKDFRKL